MNNDGVDLDGTAFTAGALLSKSFSVFTGGLVPFCLVTFIVLLPQLLFNAYGALNLSEMTPEGVQRHMQISSLFGLLLGPLASASLTFGVFQKLRGRDTPIGECLRVGLSRLLPVLGVAIATGIAVVLGMILLIIPGLIFLCALFVAPVVAVVEGSGVSDSMSRSSALTKGHRWQIFGVVFVLVLLNVGVHYLLNAILGEGQTALLAALPVHVVLTTLWAVAPVVAYQALRTSKEEVDIEELARIFD